VIGRADVAEHLAAQAPAAQIDGLHETRAPCGAPATFVHAPRLPATSHASHCPPHARSQQTPSTHWFEPHCQGVPQAAPFAFFGAHVPAWHHASEAQSACATHVPAQAPPAHSPGEQLVRVPCGGPTTVVHAPSSPGTSHASHCAPHALSQQTPSTQLPDRHVRPAAQPTPFAAFGPQLPPPQK
jgi:hypothetical protein